VTYSTLMAHLQLGQSNKGLLQIVGDLAEKFHAGVIGVAACQPMQMIYSDGYYSGELIEQDREEIEKEIKAAETEFRTTLHPRIDKLEWRGTATFAPLANYIAHHARSADLIVTGVDRNKSLLDSSRHLYMSDLVLQVGRPVFIIPASVDKLDLDRVVVGWKDTRETRRAIVDALPVLKKAAQVTIVEIAAESELASARVRLLDVVAWLRRHGVAAEFLAMTSIGDDAAQLAAITEEQGANVVVAGAYGHSRLREWALGGVTRDLLLSAERCALLSH
jgi:nucleotide-binding universal stress UspA family protein